jgi:hypothetical protein
MNMDRLKISQPQGANEILPVDRVAWSRELEYLQERETFLQGVLDELAAQKEVVAQSASLQSHQEKFTQALQAVQEQKTALESKIQAAEEAAASGQDVAEAAADGAAAAGEQGAAEAESGQAQGAAANQHIADKEGAFIAVNCPPDFCQVGDKVVPFDISRTLNHELTYAKTVFARGHSPTLTINSVIQGVDGDCGSGVASGTSLGAGDCEVITGAPTVRIEGKPVARNDDKVLMNDKNTWGYLKTLPLAPSGPPASSGQQKPQQPKQPASEAERSLEVLKGYGEGLAEPLIMAAEMAVDGWKQILNTPPDETAKALTWGAGRVLGTVAEGYGNIIDAPIETGKAVLWGAGELWGKAKEILGGGDPKAAGKLVGDVVGVIACRGGSNCVSHSA